MTNLWRRIIAVAEVGGGALSLSVTIFSAKSGASKSAILSGAMADLLVLVAGVALWVRSATGIVLSEISLALQSVQVFTHWFVWQYVAGAALLVQVIGGKIQWSGGLLVRHTFIQAAGGSETGLGVNVIAIAALTFLLLTHRRGSSAHPQDIA